MQILNKLSTIAVVAYALWNLQKFSVLLLNLFYPTLSIPIIKPIPYQDKLLPKHHIAWAENFQYLTSVYISEHPKISSYAFFDSAQLLYRSPVLSARHRTGLFSDSELLNTSNKNKPDVNSFSSSSSHLSKNSISQHLKVKLPERFWSNNGTVAYAHILVHSKNALLPNPNNPELEPFVNLNDPFMIGSVSQLVEFRPRQIDQKLSLLKHAESEANIVSQERIYKNFYEPHAKTRLSLEFVFENHRFSLYRFPSDIAPFIRLVHKKTDSASNPAFSESSENEPVPAYLPLVGVSPLSVRNIHWIPLANYSLSTSQDSAERINSETLNDFQIELTINSVSLGWFRLNLFFSNAFNNLSIPNSLFQISSEEVDNLKEMVYESDYKLLLITLVASILHIVFEFLAYKEDIAFWSKNQIVHGDIDISQNDSTSPDSSPASVDKKLEKQSQISNGLNNRKIATTNTQNSKTENQPTNNDFTECNSSQWESVSRSALVMNALSSVIGMLYLYDNKENTSVLIIIGSLISAALECWKLCRVYKISLDSLISFSTRFLSSSTSSKKTKYSKLAQVDVKDHDSNKKTSIERKSENPDKIVNSEKVIRAQVDKQTISIMLNIGTPIIIAYSIYSLFFERHTSYFSFFIHIALTTVYALEFIQMLPQLLINHKLQSVEAIPITVFMFRFFTTFIDDLFAMVIPMPTLTRIGTFRDDIVFFVLCWQWWKYPSKKVKKN
ncbi:hypothetical protein BB561_002320 [Smittium simulii]|uniref:Cleft lip and palate transmembrane 1 n=1 Tax=Smittium simulii TaxID=133385 RepID=A0A2T9YQU0_9FUNG|nr:hypothetical protein BB561_002320 [Smittium simulii]